MKVGSIRNFEWIMPLSLARGEQPQFIDYKKLKRIGIHTVLSLRETEAPPQPGWEAYRADDEASVCAIEGLRFRHVPCVDKILPEPEAIFNALSVIEEELSANRPVFMHCLYGVGRTGIIAATWEMARAGYELQQVGDKFFNFFSEMYIRNGIPLDRYEAQHREYRVLAHWWAIRTIADIFDLPINVLDPFPAEPPPNANDWESSCRKAFNQWVQLVNH